MKLKENQRIINALLSGCSLRTFMIPDDAIPTNNPEHLECYSLPHVLIFDDQFWGKTQTAHIGCHEGYVSENPCAFCYTSFGELFFSYTSALSGGVLMSKRRYKHHEWLLKPDFKLIWDSSSASDEPASIKKAIKAAATLKVALLDEVGVWHMHLVDLPMFYPERDRFVLKTVHDAYPEDFGVRSTIEAVYDQLRDFFETKPKSNKDNCTHFQCMAFSTFYEIRSDGTYRHYDDFLSGVTRRYRHLKIFSDQFE